MRRRPPRSTRTYTLFPYTTLFRSLGIFHHAFDFIVAQAGVGLDGDFVFLAGALVLGRYVQNTVGVDIEGDFDLRSEEHTSGLQSLMRISYAVFCLKKKKIKTLHKHISHIIIHNKQNTNSYSI